MIAPVPVTVTPPCPDPGETESRLPAAMPIAAPRGAVLAAETVAAPVSTLIDPVVVLASMPSPAWPTTVPFVRVIATLPAPAVMALSPVVEPVTAMPVADGSGSVKLSVISESGLMTPMPGPLRFVMDASAEPAALALRVIAKLSPAEPAIWMPLVVVTTEPPVVSCRLSVRLPAVAG